MSWQFIQKSKMIRFKTMMLGTLFPAGTQRLNNVGAMPKVIQYPNDNIPSVIDDSVHRKKQGRISIQWHGSLFRSRKN